ncbi:MET22 protein, partial [Amia calva]|nr:MET22 protein [Amia calva]
MDFITFRSDTVLSDVHLFQPNTRHLMVRLNAVGQPVFVSQFKILCNGENADSTSPPGSVCILGNEAVSCVPSREDDSSCVDVPKEEEDGVKEEEEREQREVLQSLLDEDGDLDVLRKPKDHFRTEEDVTERDRVYPIILSKGERVVSEDEEDESATNVIKIEHTMATPLEDVGKQVWRGAMLMADYILSHQQLFRGCTVLELGAGTGMTSIVMASVAKKVYCTDVGHDLLSMCERNVELNRHILEPAGGDLKVCELDWLGNDFCTDPNTEFSWTEDEVADLHNNATVLIAADVCYDDDLTDGLFRTLYRITSNLRNPSTVYFSIEKRLNFTLRHMDISCEAYDHFRSCLEDLRNITDGKMRFTLETVQPTFPQFFTYERIEQLELWKVTAKTLDRNMDSSAIK